MGWSVHAGAAARCRMSTSAATAPTSPFASIQASRDVAVGAFANLGGGQDLRGYRREPDDADRRAAFEPTRRPVMAASETARIEAFSDGVFAIAITLLVLDLKVPRDLPDGRTPGASRLAALLVAHILPVCALLAPCDPGAARRNPLHN